MLKELDQVQFEIAKGKPETASKVIGALRNQLEDSVGGGVLTPGQGDPLIDDAGVLLDSLRIGGKF